MLPERNPTGRPFKKLTDFPGARSASTSYTKDTQGYLIKRRMISEIPKCQVNVSEHKLKGGQILQAFSKASA